MNIIEQLEKIQLSREELETVFEFTGQLIEAYEQTLKEYDDAISKFQRGIPIGLVVNNEEITDVTLEKLREVREALIKDNEESIKKLLSFNQKLQQFLEIFKDS